MADFTGKSWDTLITSFEHRWDKEDKSNITLNDAFFSLQKLLERKSMVFWHMRSLERYILAQIRPFGLRIQLFPNIRNIGDEFKQKWKKSLQNCSAQLMSLLVEEYRQELGGIDDDIKKAYS